ncbi:hypothetical protein [Jiella pacifica]|uniref:hypothetical protein n=1 Tax=Jiella pacifica TaxID=2696469 RepID=UPI001FE3C38B|nr:hypothetical protein [Jiella pacifica]
MTRQQRSPVFLGQGASKAATLEPISLVERIGAVSEADIQALVHQFPECLPISEIDATFEGPVPICRELYTPAGAIDNLMVTPSGLPVIVECKLWRNPEGRREVVGQILDYAKELSRWSSSDMQREVNKRLGLQGNSLFALVQKVSQDVDEVTFNDSLTRNLRNGRFLLLIVGDGIREGVEAITEYIQRYAGLHFSLGLVELPIYRMPDGARLVVPRLLARTVNLTREVVSLPDGYKLNEIGAEADGAEIDPERLALGTAQQQFWKEFLTGLKLDDPEQPIPNPARLGYLAFSLPAPGGSCWLTVYRDIRKSEVGIFLSAQRDTPGEAAMFAVVENWQAVETELGGHVRREQDRYHRPRIIDSLATGPLEQAEARSAAFEWLRERVNAFINVLRPMIRSAVADAETRGG